MSSHVGVTQTQAHHHEHVYSGSGDGVTLRRRDFLDEDGREEEGEFLSKQGLWWGAVQYIGAKRI
jgi:hypothetical protein